MDIKRIIITLSLSLILVFSSTPSVSAFSFNELLSQSQSYLASVISAVGDNLNNFFFPSLTLSSTTPVVDIVTEQKVTPPVYSSSPQSVIQQVNPSTTIIERVVETSGVSQSYIDNSIKELQNKLDRELASLRSVIASVNTYPAQSLTPVYQAISYSNKIDSLTNTTLTNPRITGATLTASSFSGTTGTFSGALTAGSGTFTGNVSGLEGIFTGALSGATTTISGILTVSAITGTSTVGSDVNFDSGTLYIDSINNRLGVGTTSPWGQFSINPNGISGPSLVVGSSTATKFIVSNGGNVGIGTTSPFSALSVLGDGYFTGSLKTASTTATSTFAGSIRVLGSMGFTVSKIDSSFATRLDLAALGATLSDETADLNADGRIDAVGVDYTNSNMAVFLNSSGVLSSPVTYTSGTNPIDSVIGDVNNDGSPDVVVGNYTANTISVFINNGDGTFVAKVDYDTGSGPNGVDLGDINRDGWSDIVAVAQGSSAISVLLNNGNGTFASYVSYSALSGSRGANFGDFNGDGWLDVVTATWGSSKISVFLNNKDGTLATRTDYSPNSGQPYWVGVADFNSDGYQDIVSTNANGPSTVSIFMGGSSGVLSSPVAYSISIVNPFVVAVGDLNGDEKPDIVLPNNNSAQISVLINNGDGTFKTRKLYSTVAAGNSIAIGDINSDGMQDVLHGTSAYISTFINDLYPTLYAQSLVGNVGVGTSSPWAQLSINSNAISSAPSFAVGSSSATNFVVTNGGRVGVGTSTPWGLFAISPNAIGSAPAFVIGSSTISNFIVTNSGNIGIATSSPSSKLSINSASTGIGLYLAGYANSTSDLFRVSTSTLTATSTAFVIDSIGRLGVGTTSPSGRLSITQSTNTSTGGLYIAEASNTDARSIFMNTSGVLSFYGGDTAGAYNTATLDAAGAWTNASDISYKENIIPLNTKYNLQTLLNLKPVHYDMKGSHISQIGFIAQDVELQVPEVVSGEDGSKGISYGNLTALTVSALQDLSAILQIASTTTNATGTTTLSFSSLRLEDIEKRLLSLESKTPSLATTISEWVGDKVTAVFGIFTKIQTKELCVDDICITKEQFKNVFGNSSGSSSPVNTQTSTTSPSIHLNGINPTTVDKGSTYIDLGAMATDANGLSLMPDLFETTVDTSVPGNYNVVWTAHDSQMNFATATRQVIVIDPFATIQPVATTTLPTATTTPDIIDVPEDVGTSTDEVTDNLKISL